MRSRSSILVYYPVTPNIFPVRRQKFPVMSAREFARNPLTNQPCFQGRTGADRLNRRDSRLFSRVTGICAGILFERAARPAAAIELAAAPPPKQSLRFNVGTCPRSVWLGNAGSRPYGHARNECRSGQG
jgi:hypothetical protein